MVTERGRNGTVSGSARLTQQTCGRIAAEALGPRSAEAAATSERFPAHSLLPVALYPPDFTALQAAPTRVMGAGGTTSKGEFAQRTAVALTQRPRTSLIDFPEAAPAYQRLDGIAVESLHLGLGYSSVCAGRQPATGDKGEVDPAVRVER